MRLPDGCLAYSLGLRFFVCLVTRLVKMCILAVYSWFSFVVSSGFCYRSWAHEARALGNMGKLGTGKQPRVMRMVTAVD